MLQCHPHPGDFSDKSKPFHCSYFMGLQRKQGVPATEGGQFDIRLTVEEFKNSVNMYTSWKQGMEIRVWHVKRKNIPSFVFPGGVRPTRPSKLTWDMRRALELKASGHTQLDKSDDNKTALDGSDDSRKRKRVEDNTESDLRNVKPFAPSSGDVFEGSQFDKSDDSKTTLDVSDDSHKRKRVDDNMESNLRNVKPVAPFSGGVFEASQSDKTDASKTALDGSDDSHKRKRVDDNMESNLRNIKPFAPSSGDAFVAISPPISMVDSSSIKSDNADANQLGESKTEKSENNIMSGPYDSGQAFPEKLDELEDDVQYRNQVKDFSGNMKVAGQGDLSKPNEPAAQVTSSTRNPLASSYCNAGLEELEVILLLLSAR